MTITCELSLYPLMDDYESLIFEVIDCLNSNDSIQVKTHAMSTYIKGEYPVVFAALTKLYDLQSMQTHTSSLVVKIINKDLPVEDGFIF